MGSKISSVEEHVQGSEQMVGFKRYNSNSNNNSSMVFSCCKSPTNSNHSDIFTEYEVEAKRTKRCINFDVAEEHKENIPPSAPLLISKKPPLAVPLLVNRAYKVSPESIPWKKSPKLRKTVEKGSYLATFFKIFDDDVIQDFLWMDSCYKLSDKYLLAMVYTYFRRAHLSKREYNRTNFFAALYLSHDMEEDNEDLKLEIFPWVLGDRWRHNHMDFMGFRDILLKKMKYRAAVSKQTCDEVIALCPSHPIWKRERKPHHGGAERVYDTDEDFTPRGPDASPLHCALCEAYEDESEEANERSSPTFTSGYLSSCSFDVSSSPTHNGATLPGINRNRSSIESFVDRESSTESLEVSDEALLCREE